mmetsp:Transcript_5221/g.8604  ORF Transcript_5221/g.8604 Transcript_5221/m.8604 type:complete len:362 (+) Transcript_5221:54-1139(+)|eukprot:CAMPEP_0114424294 /NCGR_PEP_ID=MMETSP0103-20121206/6617_1 /TAXON_ID=37642 ORGANISM="Paraphysomonas imperforata, Strain PA2" /NCGR_SAMPLE_ID=MMETSP0103 /ASSEMBLY_ACC=CAM_ASM_000201 /LENGTH=361 /DNA_ID=CAMNT_0001593037 /DNA_START=46 /DNA_END=1131 /DNA_ORIENTATION=+
MSFVLRLTFLLAIVFAWLWKNHIDIIITLAPRHVDFYLLNMMFPDRMAKNTGVTREPMVSIIQPTEGITKDNIQDVIHKDGFPTLVKGVLSPDQDKIVGHMIERNKGKNLRMLNFEDHTHAHFSSSCGRMEMATTKSFDDYSSSHLLSSKADNHSYLYAGFEAITEAQTVNDITGLDVESLGDYKQNNLFTSNFPHEVFTATTHCAPIDSLTMQLIGTKTWYFVAPEELADIPSIPMPTAFALPITDDELISKVKNIYVLRQEPGDVMYFGPHWCHAVSTAPGPNLMMNMRYKTLSKILNGPLKLAAKILMRTFVSNRGNGLNPQDNKSLYPGIYNALNNWFEDCGESTWFTALHRRTTGQ